MTWEELEERVMSALDSEKWGPPESRIVPDHLRVAEIERATRARTMRAIESALTACLLEGASPRMVDNFRRQIVAAIDDRLRTLSTRDRN